ncbi:hypothetical protein F4820DRAFT_464489 [Hypoxylon rubiginosum]|uniref:Uncharacterized protein n=1 Tax=Hypoxylon rubiginosum TaxID=110542 RepID=A0ACB9YQK6_9PEZI|nr:hypothetical protein F4820DRAFT_464489 [Hypoxylon rubiginosum]
MASRNEMALVKSSTGPTLLNIPVELRLEIYDYLLHNDRGTNYITADVPCKAQWTGEWDGQCTGDEHNILSLLLVCRQFHREIAPLVYRAVAIGQNGFEPTMWQEFFHTIGPTNISYIKDLAITYHCSMDLGYFQYGYGHPHLSTSADLWWALFETMHELGVQPKRVFVNVEKCDYLCAPSSGRCKTWVTMDFLKSLSWLLDGVDRVVLSGEFNPLWAYGLKARFGLQTICQSGQDCEEVCENGCVVRALRGKHASWKGAFGSGDHYLDHFLLESPVEDGN